MAGPADRPHNIAQLLAVRGYIVATLDNRGFGEREIGQLPVGTRCNTLHLLYSTFGYHLHTLNIHDQFQVLDYLTSRTEVDENRIGVLGRSYGGTLSQYVAALDSRIKAAGIVCYAGSFGEFGVEDVVNDCGSQHVHGIYRYADVATITGLIAPRPCLIQNGFSDQCFAVDSVVKSHRELETIYRAAQAEDKLLIDVFDGGHDYHGPVVFDFFDRWLEHESHL